MATCPISNDVSDAREWFSAAELAELGLPGLPGDKRSITRRAQEERWITRTDGTGERLVRPRKGRGGGTEFHVSLLPGPARLELSRRGISTGPAPAEVEDPAASGWRWYEGQSAKVKREAERRAAIVAEIELLEESGLTRTAAIAEISSQKRIGRSTLLSWQSAIDGIDPANRLPALAPRRRGGGSAAEIDPLLWSAFKSDFLRPSAPTLTSCYDRTAELATAKGLSMPSERTFRRRLERETDPSVIKLLREGEEALRQSLPPQRRTVDHLRALEHVNVDGHRFDVFVQHPTDIDRKTGKPKVFRPLMVAIQDVYSSKVLAWRIGDNETNILTRLAFADVFRNFGIPRACTLDNGRAFASKWITGGAKTRFRFKVRDEEPTGLLTVLGIKTTFTLPYRGQSKPIERAFRDMCDRIAKHHAMEGAYTGNSPMAKPENYGSRAIAWEAFLAHVEQGIIKHNAQPMRRGRRYNGRSFDQVFEESYKSSPVGKATPEQLRMALLAADQKVVNRKTGMIELYGNRYWSDACRELHGQRVTVRFDPDNLREPIHLYAQDGHYIASAPMIEDTGFDDVAAARTHAKKQKDLIRKVKDAAEAEQLLAAEELAALLPDAEAPSVPEPSVIRPVRHSGFRSGAATARKIETSLEPGKSPIDRMRGAIKLRLIEDN